MLVDVIMTSRRYCCHRQQSPCSATCLSRRQELIYQLSSGYRSRAFSTSRKDTEGLPLAPLKLFSANGGIINTFGSRTITLDLGLDKPIMWPCVIADEPHGILGTDFLSHNHLTVDVASCTVIEKLTGTNCKGYLASSPLACISTHNGTAAISQILADFPEVTEQKPPTPLKDSIPYHDIVTTGPPCAEPYRNLSKAKMKIAKELIDDMVAKGMMRPSKSPYASPLHLEKKKNAQFRACGDYRKLNAQTVLDRYPIPRIEDCTYLLQGKKVFSKIDLVLAFWHIPAAPRAR